MSGRRGFLLGIAAVLAGCTPGPAPDGVDAGAGSDAAAPEDGGLKDGESDGESGGESDAESDAESSDGAAAAASTPVVERPAALRCPPEMVRVAGAFCVDRYEAVLLDKATGMALSAFYPPSRRQAESVERIWSTMRFEMGNEQAQRMDLPLLPGWQKQRDFEPRAVSRKGVVPQGYASGAQAALACRNAGKRLCTLEEWRTACRGERDEPFPYGSTYAPGRCNVFREGHPAAILHKDPTIGHSDPRLNLVEVEGARLLRRTGQTAACQSAWGGDAIADLVGNLDEWVDDPEGTFVGGFYARSTKEGCMARVTTHPFGYFDYSTGVRCCADAHPDERAR